MWVPRSEPVSEGCVLGEPLGLPEAVPDAVSEGLPEGLCVGLAELVGVGGVLGVAVNAAHSLAIVESESTMFFASSRLVAAIEDCTFAWSVAGSPATATVAEL